MISTSGRIQRRHPASPSPSSTSARKRDGGARVVLDDVLAQRAALLPPKSYTAELLRNDNKRMKKMGKEMAGFLRALHVGSDDDIVEAAADFFLGRFLCEQRASLRPGNRRSDRAESRTSCLPLRRRADLISIIG